MKRALERVDAGPGGKNMVYWTSLREVRSNDRFKNIPIMILLGTGDLCCWKTTRPTSHQSSARECHVGIFYCDAYHSMLTARTEQLV